MTSGKDISRRGFLFGAAATTASLASGEVSPRKKGAAQLDPNRVVLISDVHIPLPRSEQKWRTAEYPWIIETVKKHLDEILALDPLPAQIISLGDMSIAFGEDREYEIWREMLKPVWDRGIKVTLAMGNHDFRASFAKSFPECAAESLVPGRYVYKVETPNVDFLVLDTLKEPSERGDYRMVTGYELGAEQTAWAKKTLLELKKPTFVCAHHSISQCGLLKEIVNARMVVGYLHGHDHHWINNFVTTGYSKASRTIRSIGIGALAINGDVGYGVMDIRPQAARLQMIAKDFYYPFKLPKAERPKVWDAIYHDSIGHKVFFPF